MCSGGGQNEEAARSFADTFFDNYGTDVVKHTIDLPQEIRDLGFNTITMVAELSYAVSRTHFILKTAAATRPPLSGDVAFKLLGTDMNGVMTTMGELRTRNIHTNIVDKAMASLDALHKGIPPSIIVALSKQFEKKLDDLAEPSQAGPLPQFMKIVFELTGSPPGDDIKNGVLTSASSKEAGNFFKGFGL